MKKLILIITSSEEPNVKNVTPFLDKMEERYLRLDTDTLSLQGNIDLGIRDSSWMMSFLGESVFISDIKSVWYRRPGVPKDNEDVFPLYRDFVKNETLKFFHSLWSLLDSDQIRWMNRPLAGVQLEFNKPYQMQIASRIGLKIPRTIITNDVRSAIDFIDECQNNTVIKMFGGSNVANEKGKSLVLYVKPLKREDVLKFRDVFPLCPIMIQEYVPKKVEIRATVVGEKTFSCAIHSQDSERTKHDWRKYDFENVKHEIHHLPSEIEAKLVRYMKDVGLSFGAIDLILTPDGEYVFLEVNPSGQWAWIETLTNMPISENIALYLSGRM